MRTGEEINDDDVLPSAFLESNDLRWVDDNNKIHKVPRDKDIRETANRQINNKSGQKTETYSDSGSVGSGDVARLATVRVRAGGKLLVTSLTLMPLGGGGLPEGAAMTVSRLTGDNHGEHIRTLVEGDGQRDFLDSEQGGQLAYKNDQGNAHKIMIGVDNGHYLQGTGDRIEVEAGVKLRLQ